MLAEQSKSNQAPVPTAAGGDAFEAEVARLFAEILGLRSVAPADSFFELGGKSLAALELLNRIAGEYHVEIPPGAFFAEPSVRATARNLVQGLLAAAKPDTLARLLSEFDPPPNA